MQVPYAASSVSVLFSRPSRGPTVRMAANATLLSEGVPGRGRANVWDARTGRALAVSVLCFGCLHRMGEPER
jgi:hypothetical protein